MVVNAFERLTSLVIAAIYLAVAPATATTERGGEVAIASGSATVAEEAASELVSALDFPWLLKPDSAAESDESAAPEAASAETPDIASMDIDDMRTRTSGDFDYVTWRGEAVITAYRGSATNLTLPDRLDGIPVIALDEDVLSFSGLATVRIPVTVTALGDSPFAGCPMLRRVEVDPANRVYESVDGVLFDKIHGTLVTYPASRAAPAYEVPAGTRALGGWAFDGCERLTDVTLPEGLVEIGARAFNACTELTGVVLPESLAVLGSRAFNYCYSLTEINIPASVTDIGDNPFDCCVSLVGISVSPENLIYAALDGVLFDQARRALVTYLAGKSNSAYAVPAGTVALGVSAFSECAALSRITFPDSLAEIDDYALFGCGGLTRVVLPAGVERVGLRALGGCAALTAIDVVKDNPVFASEEGVLFDKRLAALVCYPQAKGGVIYTVPEGTLELSESAFEACEGLVAVVLPQGLARVGEWAFASCPGMGRVLLGDGLTHLGDSAFAGCASMSKLALPDSLVSIGENVFSGCGSLSQLTLPASVRHIGDSAFQGCPGIVIDVGSNSYAERYARRLGIPFTLARGE
jgi:hypothetical protein